MEKQNTLKKRDIYTNNTMFEKALVLASKFPNTFVFGGYVRDVMLGGKCESGPKDLDLFFQKEKDVSSFIDIVSIFFPLVERTIERGTKNNGYLNNDNDVITCKFSDDENNHFIIDCVFPNQYNNPMYEKEPILYENVDMDVNMFFLKLSETKNQLQICNTPPYRLGESEINKELSFIKTLKSIHRSRFKVLNTPQQLAKSPRQHYQECFPDLNVVRKKAIKLVLRAEKMVLRGWTQENEDAGSRTWHVVKFRDLNKTCANPRWSNAAEIITTETRCSICHDEYHPDQTVFVGPCGHTYHVCCSDYGEANSSVCREDSGIVGWIKAQIRRTLEVETGDDMRCLLCKRNFF